jgi:DNA-binding NtrC family response regulator
LKRPPAALDCGAAVDVNLLILDDDELVGILIETVGRLAGLPTRLTSDHETFFAELAAAPPSHVVLDLTMPGMPGEAVLQGLAERGCAARVVVVSGAGPQRLAAAAALAQQLGLAFAGAIPKPFTPAALRQVLLAP